MRQVVWVCNRQRMSNLYQKYRNKFAVISSDRFLRRVFLVLSQVLVHVKRVRPILNQLKISTVVVLEDFVSLYYVRCLRRNINPFVNDLWKLFISFSTFKTLQEFFNLNVLDKFQNKSPLFIFLIQANTFSRLGHVSFHREDFNDLNPID